MSKIGQKPIIVPASVQASVQGQTVLVKGKNGELTVELPVNLSVTQEAQTLTLQRKNELKKTKSVHGLYRQLISNAVQGVETFWQKKLEVVGTGYNVKLQGEDLVFKLGYSHPVIFKKVPHIRYQVEGNNKICVLGVDKQLVGQIAFQLKLLKKPDAYKGKGIRYEGEKLRIKPGKKAKTATTGAA